MAVVSRDKTNPTTINELRQYYDLEQISKTKKAVSTQGETITQINAEQSNILNSIIMNMTGLENQEDMSLWFFNEVPTLLNLPTSDWATDELKDSHLGDLYYNRETGYTYKFILTGEIYSWEQVLDNEIIQAMALTNSEIDVSDSQRKVFFTTPTAPYSNGDWWLKEEGLYVCQISRIEGQTFRETDFIIGSKYVVGTQATEINNKLTVTNGRVATVEVGIEEINQKIEEIVDITDYIKTVTGNNTITLNNTFASDCVISYIKFSNLVDNTTLYPGSTLYPSLNIFPSGVLTYNLRIYNNGFSEEVVYNIPASGLLNYDDYIEITNGDVYVTQNGITTKLPDKIYIRTYDNTTTIRMELGANVLGDKIDVTYLEKNNLSDAFTPRIEKEASIKIATDEINLEVNKKVGQDEIISRINLSPEEIAIKSNKISLEGYTTINDGFSVDLSGNCITNGMTANDVNVIGGNITLEDTGTSSNPTIEIYDSSAVIGGSLQIGDNLNGKRLNFSFLDTGEIMDNLSLGGVWHNTVTTDNGNYIQNYHDSATGYEEIVLINYNGSYVYPYIMTDHIIEGNALYYILPSDFGTITAIDSSNGILQYIELDNVNTKTTKFNSNGISVVDEVAGINTFYGKNGLEINDEDGRTILDSDLFEMDMNGHLIYISTNPEFYIDPSTEIMDIDGKFKVFAGGGIRCAGGLFDVDSSGNVTCVSLTQTSKEEMKKNFEKFDNALDIIDNIDIYKYHFKEQDDKDKKHIGFVIGDKYKYSEEITSNNNDGVDLYSMVSVCMKAIKEQQEQIDKLNNEILLLKESDK